MFNFHSLIYTSAVFYVLKIIINILVICMHIYHELLIHLLYMIAKKLSQFFTRRFNYARNFIRTSRGRHAAFLRSLSTFPSMGFRCICYLHSMYFGSFHRDALQTHLRRRHVDTRDVPITLVTEIKSTRTGWVELQIHR